MMNGERKLILPDLNFGVVGYGSMDSFREIQDFLLMLPSFKIVYMKVGLDKLWLKEGRNTDEDINEAKA